MFTLQPGPSTCNNSQLTTPARHPPTSQPHQPTQQETIPRFPDAEKLVSVKDSILIEKKLCKKCCCTGIYKIGEDDQQCEGGAREKTTLP